MGTPDLPHCRRTECGTCNRKLDKSLPPDGALASSAGSSQGRALFFTLATNTSHDGAMTNWEYLILELPSFEPATHAPGASAAAHALNEEGARGWEAVGMTALPDGRTVVLLKRSPE
jgi:hypothetical protein